MPGERMTVARLAKDLKGLSERIDQRFERVDQRFAQVDESFEQQRQETHRALEEFATRIETSFKVSPEGMEAKLDAALDDTREQKRRLDLLDRTNAQEHRLIQAQIDEIDAKFQSRRRLRRPS